MSWVTSLLNELAPGIQKGITAGLNYDAQIGKLFVKSLETGNTEMQADALGVMKQFLSEILDEVTGLVKGNLVQIIEAGGDPFEQSRKMAQAAIAKWGV